MKLFLLVVAFLFMCKPVYAKDFKQPASLTVEDVYLWRKQDIVNDEFFLYFGYFRGIQDSNTVKYLDDEKKSRCINRPILLWCDIVIDRYKLNKINGEEQFVYHLMKTMEEICEVDLLSLFFNNGKQ